jgi:hypothetical protein
LLISGLVAIPVGYLLLVLGYIFIIPVHRILGPLKNRIRCVIAGVWARRLRHHYVFARCAKAGSHSDPTLSSLVRHLIAQGSG